MTRKKIDLDELADAIEHEEVTEMMGLRTSRPIVVQAAAAYLEIARQFSGLGEAMEAVEYGLQGFARTEDLIGVELAKSTGDEKYLQKSAATRQAFAGFDAIKAAIKSAPGVGEG